MKAKDNKTPSYNPISDEELERVQRETAARDEVEPRITGVYYSANGMMMLEMRTGTFVKFFARNIPALKDATDSQILATRLVSDGSAIHWTEIDVQMSTIALLQIVLGKFNA
jgi:hypothetical protein